MFTKCYVCNQQLEYGFRGKCYSLDLCNECLSEEYAFQRKSKYKDRCQHTPVSAIMREAMVEVHRSLPRTEVQPTDDCNEMNKRSRELGQQLRKSLLSASN